MRQDPLARGSLGIYLLAQPSPHPTPDAGNSSCAGLPACLPPTLLSPRSRSSPSRSEARSRDPHPTVRLILSVHDELRALRSLAKALGVHTRYTDGLGKRVIVAPETLLRVCVALGAPLERPGDAADALRAHRATKRTAVVPPVLVAWDGALPPIALPHGSPVHAELRCADGELVPLEPVGAGLRTSRALPAGYHHLTVEGRGRVETHTVIAAPVRAWRRPGSHRSWGGR